MFHGAGVLATPGKKPLGCEYSEADDLGPLIPLWEPWLRPLAELTGRLVDDDARGSLDPRPAVACLTNGRLGMSERIAGAGRDPTLE